MHWYLHVVVGIILWKIIKREASNLSLNVVSRDLQAHLHRTVT
jgi:hypothetical protein